MLVALVLLQFYSYSLTVYAGHKIRIKKCSGAVVREVALETLYPIIIIYSCKGYHDEAKEK